MSGSLHHSPAEVIRQLLIDLSAGTDPDNAGTWPVYATQEPDAPDDCITVYDTAGIDGGRENVQNERAIHHGLQVRVRAANHEDGYPKANAIALLMDTGMDHVAVSVTDDTGTEVASYVVYAVTRKTDVLPLGREQGTSRVLFTINAVAALRQT